MTDPSDMTPELADLAARLSKLDLDNPGDLEALFEMQEELAALTGIEMPPPGELPTIAPEEPEQPDDPPSNTYLAAADPTIPLDQFIELAGADIHETINTQTLLFPACITGSLEKATWLIAQGLDPDHRDQNGYTPLIYACLPGINANLDLIRFLISKGADVNAGSSYSESPLRLSVRTGNYEAARILVEAGADAGEFPPLHQAAASGNLDTIATLVSPQTLEEKSAPWERTPWLTAIHADQVDAAHLLKSCGADVTALDHTNATALHLAAESNAHNSIRYLLSLGDDIDSRDNFNCTPLHLTAENDTIDSAELLLTGGANVHALTQTEDTPANLADSVTMLTLLHAHGADIDHMGGDGNWPLRNAAESNDLPAVRWLIEQGVNINHASSLGTALHAAVFEDNLEIVQALISAGIDPNKPDCDGDTPLHRLQSIDAANLLLQAGADPTIPNMVGQHLSEIESIPEDIRNFIKSYQSS